MESRKNQQINKIHTKVHYRETAEHYRQEDLKSNWKKCQVTFKEIIVQLRTDFSTITIKSQESKLISWRYIQRDNIILQLHAYRNIFQE